jgi:hypothetical protein
MLDAFIIEELKRRKEERLRRDLNRPVAELPAPDEIPPEPKDEPASGVVIIDYNA